MRYKYSHTKSAHDKREAIISQIPYDKYIRHEDVKGDDRKEVKKSLRALVKHGHIRKIVEYTSAKGKNLYRRVVG